MLCQLLHSLECLCVWSWGGGAGGGEEGGVGKGAPSGRPGRCLCARPLTHGLGHDSGKASASGHCVCSLQTADLGLSFFNLSSGTWVRAEGTPNTPAPAQPSTLRLRVIKKALRALSHLTDFLFFASPPVSWGTFADGWSSRCWLALVLSLGHIVCIEGASEEAGLVQALWCLLWEHSSDPQPSAATLRERRQHHVCWVLLPLCTEAHCPLSSGGDLVPQNRLPHNCCLKTRGAFCGRPRSQPHARPRAAPQQ